MPWRMRSPVGHHVYQSSCSSPSVHSDRCPTLLSRPQYIHYPLQRIALCGHLPQLFFQLGNADVLGSGCTGHFGRQQVCEVNEEVVVQRIADVPYERHLDVRPAHDVDHRLIVHAYVAGKSRLVVAVQAHVLVQQGADMWGSG